MGRHVSPARSLVLVKVTQKHIDKGERWSPSRDPIARALHSAGLRRWKSGFTSFVVGKFSKRVPMPDSVKSFVSQFDNNPIKCKPFEFEVDLNLARL